MENFRSSLCGFRKTIVPFPLKGQRTSFVQPSAENAHQSGSAKMSRSLRRPWSGWTTANHPNAPVVHAEPPSAAEAAVLERQLKKRLGNISSGAGRKRAGPTRGIAGRSNCSSRVVEKPTSTKFAVTTCSNFSTSCESGLQRETGPPIGESPYSTISSR